MFILNDVNHLEDLEVEGQRVFVRADLDVPHDASGEIQDDAKLVAAAPTLRWLLDRKAKVTIGAHLGPLSRDPLSRNPLSKSKAGPRSAPPNREDDEASGQDAGEATPPSLVACAERLAELVGCDVLLPDETLGAITQKLLRDQRDGQLLLLENLARDAAEGAAEDDYARALTANVDLYVVDGLFDSATSASLALAPKLCRQRAMGPRLRAELLQLDTLWTQKSSLLLVGGDFAARKGLLGAALNGKRTLLTGAALGLTLHRAKVGPANAQTVPELRQARTWLDRARDLGRELHLPLDFVCRSAGKTRIETPIRAAQAEQVLDLGPETVAHYQALIRASAAALLVDPLGAPGEASATQELLKALTTAESANALRLVLTDGDLRVDAAQIAPSCMLSTCKPGALSLLAGQRNPALEALRIPL